MVNTLNATKSFWQLLGFKGTINNESMTWKNKILLGFIVIFWLAGAIWLPLAYLLQWSGEVKLGMFILHCALGTIFEGPKVKWHDEHGHPNYEEPFWPELLVITGKGAMFTASLALITLTLWLIKFYFINQMWTGFWVVTTFVVILAGIEIWIKKH